MRPRRPEPVWLLALVVPVLLGMGVYAWRADQVARQPVAAAPAAAVAASTRPAELRLLEGWDRRRAAAYASGDLRALRGLYVAGSVAGRRDVALLRSYLRRGLTVQDMRMQVLSARVVGRRSGELRLRVTDRLAGAVAVGDDLRQQLPSDSATTRVVVLRLVGEEWRMGEVRPVPARSVRDR